MDAELESEATFVPTDSSVAEARRFVAEELWARDLLDTSEPVLGLIEEVGDLVGGALVCGDSPAQTVVDLADGKVELVVEATTASSVGAESFDPGLLDASLVEVMERRADLPRPVERVTVRVRVARRLRVRRAGGAPRAARDRPARAVPRRRRRRPRRRGSPR
jgi:hypothetical protein